jgi:hypothetical protein
MREWAIRLSMPAHSVSVHVRDESECFLPLLNGEGKHHCHDSHALGHDTHAHEHLLVGLVAEVELDEAGAEDNARQANTKWNHCRVLSKRLGVSKEERIV